MALIDLILVLADPEFQKLIGVPCQDSKKLIYSFKLLFSGGNHQPSAFSGRVLYVMRALKAAIDPDELMNPGALF
jgi:hypothetical protein